MDTDLKAALAERDRLRAELEGFLFAVSHDLQRPIRHARCYSELLMRRCEQRLDAESIELADRVVKAGREAQALLEGLLRLSRVSTRGKPFAPTDCNELLDSAAHRLATAVEESGAEIERSALPVVDADADQLEDVFTLLIENAIKFRNPARPPRIAVGAEECDGRWVFAVRDNGIGIDPKDHGRIFVVFQRLHTAAEYPGLGLGLAMCKAVVERHGGLLTVDSELGRGATFRFSMPKRAVS